jgi:catechol 2,3-dioxygenase-like lactoylglutathione lyase family enzyme
MESDNVGTSNVAPSIKGGIPGMRGVEHIGLTVPNLEEATEFFVDVLGCEVIYSLYPPRRTDNYLDIHPDTDRKIRTLSCRNGAHFELFEYTAPDQNKHMPKSSDYGGHHVTFYVDDMDAAIAHLKIKGVYLFGEKRNGYGAEAGKDSTFVHFKTPWGLVLELISFPNGRAYEQEKPAMWQPAPLTS